MKILVMGSGGVGGYFGGRLAAAGVHLVLCDRNPELLASSAAHARSLDVQVVEVVGDVRDRHALIVDDEIATGGTILEAAEMVRRMLERGLLSRERTEDDQRANAVSITQNGRKALRSARA